MARTLKDKLKYDLIKFHNGDNKQILYKLETLVKQDFDKYTNEIFKELKKEYEDINRSCNG